MRTKIFRIESNRKNIYPVPADWQKIIELRIELKGDAGNVIGPAIQGVIVDTGKNRMLTLTQPVATGKIIKAHVVLKD